MRSSSSRATSGSGGWNRGMREVGGRWFLILNADAWVVGDAVERLVEFGREHPRAAIVGPRHLNPDGTLQRSVRGFPTLWRLATEYLFLRKLAPRSSVLNAYYGGGFDHDEAREAEVVMGSCMLVRRAAIEEVGEARRGLLPLREETDWCYRFVRAGLAGLVLPGRRVRARRRRSHGGRLFRENVRSHLRFLAKHRGMPYAERARWLLACRCGSAGAVPRRARVAVPRGLRLARERRRAGAARHVSDVVLLVRLALATAIGSRRHRSNKNIPLFLLLAAASSFQRQTHQVVQRRPPNQAAAVNARLAPRFQVRHDWGATEQKYFLVK